MGLPGADKIGYTCATSSMIPRVDSSLGVAGPTGATRVPSAPLCVEASEGPWMKTNYTHRVNLTAEHYHLVRVFMVGRRLSSARVAAGKMIEIAAKVAGAEEEAFAMPAGAAKEHEDN